MAGVGVTLGLAFWAMDLCVPCLALPVTFFPGCCSCLSLCSACLLQSPLTLSLTQAGWASPASQGRKLTSLVGLVPCHFFMQPQDPLCRGWEHRVSGWWQG